MKLQRSAENEAFTRKIYAYSKESVIYNNHNLAIDHRFRNSILV